MHTIYSSTTPISLFQTKPNPQKKHSAFPSKTSMRKQQISGQLSYVYKQGRLGKEIGNSEGSRSFNPQLPLKHTTRFSRLIIKSTSFFKDSNDWKSPIDNKAKRGMPPNPTNSRFQPTAEWRLRLPVFQMYLPVDESAQTEEFYEKLGL